MTMSSSPPSTTQLQHFLVSFPHPYVALIETNRSEKLNAFHEAMWVELGRFFTHASTDPNIRAIVLAGRGSAFSAGLDLKAASNVLVMEDEKKEGGNAGYTMVAVDGARRAMQLQKHIRDFQDSVSAIEKCIKPVIAVLHGACIGLAIDIACCADVRVASADAMFSVKEVDVGLAADIGTLARLPKLVGSGSWVRDVCLTARTWNAAEAEHVGFVSATLPDKAAALAKACAIAQLIAQKSPVAVVGTKEILVHARDHSVDENLRYTAIWNSAMLQTADIKAAISANSKGKSKPTFAKL